MIMDVPNLQLNGLSCNVKCDTTFYIEHLYGHASVLDEYDISYFPVLNSMWDDYETVEVAHGLTIQTTDMQSQVSLETNGILLSDLEDKHTCKQCNRSFKREKAFLSHLKLNSTFHNVFDNSGEGSFDSVQNNFQIGIKTDSHNKNLCSRCYKSFPTKQKLKRHMWVHKKKTFTCEMCTTSFQNKQDLNQHRLTKHRSSSGYSCSECGKSFSSRPVFLEHKRLHNSTKHSYKCAQCLKTISSKQGYYIHIRMHNDERPYKCNFCKKEFRDGGTLRKHERIHTGLRPHVCPICSKAFNQKVVLREHLRSVHVSKWKTNEDKFFQCTLCDFEVSEKYDLCAHLVKHSDNLAEKGKTTIVSEDNTCDNNEQINGFDSINYSNNLPEMGSTTEVSGNNIEDIEDDYNAIDMKIENINEYISTKCDICNIEFLSMEELGNHAQSHI
ncbi:hypothetical protein FQR65_LT02297 [Abscondita terminalis]|nr:hypothetical protein FQR65_LT02297 [Abscondita terminalis]